MRIGTTSYIYPADIQTNVKKLAGRVEDVELVLFESDEDGTNLPDDASVALLNSIARQHGMTYTVHLPLDLRLAGDDPSLSRALRVIRRTRPLDPVGYVVHLDDGEQGPVTEMWTENSLRSLDRLIAELGSPELICAENLDNQPPEALDRILLRSPVSCCVDVGHLWKQGQEPRAWLERWLPRARIVHLHGVGRRDHKGLSLVPAPKLDDVVHYLSGNFLGVVTIEVFNEVDFLDSLEAIAASRGRARGIQQKNQ